MAVQPLIIFDCDGVLVDSEPLSIAVLVEMLASIGVGMDAGEAKDRFLGRSLSFVTDTLRDDYGVLAGDDFLERMRTRLYERFRQELKPVPGIGAALAELDDARCVASSSQPERIRLSLELTGLGEFFGPRIYSATMVANGKPAPDLFLYAAGKTGYAPADCIVIEDSPAGIMAARAAGMTVFAFTGGSHAQSAAFRAEIAALSPDVVFDAMSDLVHLVREYREGRVSGRDR